MTRKVLVIDDTNTSRQLLVHIINHSGDMQVIGEGSNGEHAVQLAHDLHPDIILMDIVMPRMDGLEATRQIMQSSPVPIVLITASLDTRETETAFQAMQAGALTVLQKPDALNPAEVNLIRRTVRAMSDVKVIHHFDRKSSVGQSANGTHIRTRPAPAVPEIVAIAASTGGPAAIASILSALPASFPLPILIAQHISTDFVESLTGWLQNITDLNVNIAETGVRPQAGNVYVARADSHLKVANNGSIQLDSERGAWRYLPSCDVLLYSVAHVYPGRAIGVVLTGMGDDGADGLRAMYEQGSTTIAQDEASSVVYGMPHQAVVRGGVQHVLPLTEIAPALLKIVDKQPSV